jgi:hypothetical protein
LFHNAAQFREDVVEVARSICEESVEKLLENFHLFSFFGDRKHCAEAAVFLFASGGAGAVGWFTVKKWTWRQ